MEKIDLDAIINTTYETSFGRAEVYKFMKEAINQALILASERARTTTEPYNDWSEEGGTMYVVDKPSILNVNKLVVNS